MLKSFVYKERSPMKKRITALALAIFMVLGTVALAAGTEKNITVTPMTLSINGQQVTPTKSDGAAAEVFSYDGATYVPLRYLSELLGIKVEWDKNAPNTAKLVMDKMTYTATVNGNNGPLTVTTTIADGKIADVTVGDNVETVGVADNALVEIPRQIVEYQSTNIDAVTGATITSFTIAAAVKDCLTQAGLDTANFNTKVQPQQIAETRKESCDVLVIGGGGGGLAAAVKAAQAGKSVILIEKLGMLGGDTTLNAGTLIATGSRFQREDLGEKNDSPELAYADIMKVGKNANDPAMVTMITNTIGSTVDWLIDDLKIPYDVAATQYPDHSAARQIGAVRRSPAWVEKMSEKLTEFGGKILLSTRGTDLLTDNKGAVIGVRATDKQGVIEFTAKSVVMAAGGFGAATELLPDTLAGYKFYGRSTETGDGLKMGTAIGADTINLDMVKVYPQGVETQPNRALAATASSTAATAGHGAIYVNTAGKRIIKETATLGELTDITVEQSDKIMYIVMDEDAWQAYIKKSLEDRLVPTEADLYKWADIKNDGKPVLAYGKDLSELAKTMGIDANGLLAEVKHYNEMCAAGTDKDFGKESPVALAEGGNYYVVEQKPRFATTLGGLKANTDMQIMGTNGKPIANLYGAGCVVGGGNGKDSMTAMMNSWAIGSGAVAGANAAKNAK